MKRKLLLEEDDKSGFLLDTKFDALGSGLKEGAVIGFRIFILVLIGLSVFVMYILK